MNKSRLLIFTFFIFLSASVCLAEVTNTWNGSTDTDWFTATNWSENVCPSNGHHVIVDSISSTTNVLLTNSTWNLVSFTITNKTLTFTNWTTTLNASNVTIQSGATLTLPGAFTNNAMSNRVHIVCTNFTLASGGTIDVDGKGYTGGVFTAGYGPGGGFSSGNYGGGGGYGGNGGNTDDSSATGGIAYGSSNAPVEPGSGGGGGDNYYGAAGGGAVRIEATGNVAINGTITANGKSSTVRGAGSGGGIFITCKRFDGSTNGLLCADGGNGSPGSAAYGGGGGSGGRIAVIYNGAAQTNQPGVRFSTAPGSGQFPGEMGTVYLPDTLLFLSETLKDELFMDVRLFVPGFTNWAPVSLTMSNCVVTFGEEAFQLTVTNDVYIDSGSSLGLLADSRMDCRKNVIITDGSLSLSSGSILNCDGHITVSSGGTISLGANPVLDCDGDIIVTNGSIRLGMNTNATDGSVSFGTNSVLNCGSNMTIAGSGSLRVYSVITNAASPGYGALVSVAGDVSIGASSWIYPYAHSTNGGSVLFRMNNLTIVANGGFNADGKGYAGYTTNGYGPGGGGGLPSENYGGGGGYGGKGGDAKGGVGGVTYGSTNAPAEPGSGGGGGTGLGAYGGGLVRIEATGNITVDGTITADGEDSTYRGGGSGGGIFIMCEQFGGSANGLLCADGGNGSIQNPTVWGGGGGGGGRIAVWYAVPESERARILAGDMRRVSIITNASDYLEFLGTVSVTNGTGYTNLPPVGAECGTIVFLTVTPPSGTMFMCQ